jgi:hypothetical protein
MTFSGCAARTTTTQPPTQDPYLAVARAINDIQQGNKSFATTVTQANAQKLISDATTRNLLAISLRIAQGGDQAAAVIQGLTTLPPGTKVTLWTTLKPIAQAVNDSLATGLIPITDQNTRTTVQAILTTIQGALAIIQIQTGGQ